MTECILSLQARKQNRLTEKTKNETIICVNVNFAYEESRMIKVFLVEDERIIRKSIKENIPWKDEGFIFAGEAGDGELALPLIRQEKPDILITDVKMPFMGGLELAEIVKKEMPQIKIIILSGFKEFAYAKKAITIGVAEYLSKPITSERLLQVCKSIKTDIEEEREEEKLKATYHEEMLEKNELERRLFFNTLLTRSATPSELIKNAERLNIDLIAQAYAILLLRIWDADESEEGRVMSIKAMQEVTRTFLCKDIELFDRGLDGIAMLIKAKGEGDTEKAILEIAERLKALLAKFPLISYFAGIGKPVSRMSELPLAYQSANKAFAMRFFSEANTIMFSQKKETERTVSTTLSFENPESLGWKPFELFFSTGNLLDIEPFVTQYLADISQEDFQKSDIRTHVALNAYLAAKGFAKDQKLEGIAITVPDERDIADRESLYAYLSHTISQILEAKESRKCKSVCCQIAAAIAFISAHCTDYSTSLSTVAEHVHMSPNYLSTLFSSEMGKTFIEFLTEQRMEKAKALLVNTTAHTADISLDVGYQDSHYFSFLFKKYTGQSPKEYRKSHANT